MTVGRGLVSWRIQARQSEWSASFVSFQRLAWSREAEPIVRLIRPLPPPCSALPALPSRELHIHCFPRSPSDLTLAVPVVWSSLHSFLVQLFLTRYGSIVHSPSLLLHTTHRPGPVSADPLFTSSTPLVTKHPLTAAVAISSALFTSLSLSSIISYRDPQPSLLLSIISTGLDRASFTITTHSPSRLCSALSVLTVTLALTLTLPLSLSLTLCTHNGFLNTHCNAFAVTDKNTFRPRCQRQSLHFRLRSARGIQVI